MLEVVGGAVVLSWASCEGLACRGGLRGATVFMTALRLIAIVMRCAVAGLAGI